jgi:putative oxidoreductase
MSIAIDTQASTPAAVAVRQPDLEDVAKLLLRVSLGLLMLFHGVAKINNGIDPILGAVAQAGFPAALAYGVYVGEVVAPLLLIVGVWTRAAAIVVAVNMLVAVALVHLNDLGALSSSGGWALELQAFYFVSAVAVVLLGPGRFAAGSQHDS